MATRKPERTFTLSPEADQIIAALPQGQKSPWVDAAIREKAAQEVA
ncbi:MAG: hypothetical protein WC455_12640 [Dehalococcoidia bacterium]|jgi:hypothetical protein